ncbi:MAG: M20 family metallopeptidase [Blastocatellia bacterium]
MKEEIVDLATALIRIPSRVGVDSPDPILEYLKDWTSRHHLRTEYLFGVDGAKIGLFAHIASGRPGPVLCLNACIDTAPFGNEKNWTDPPTSGKIRDGHLYGRGAADSKMGVAIFSSLASALQRDNALPAGELYVVFDADEHSGEFQGIKSFIRTAPKIPKAALIGYPNNDRLIIGSRGFLRGAVSVYGTAAHSGSGSSHGFNAIDKAACLIQAIHNRQLPEEPDPVFHHGPRVTVTEITGGQGYSVVPDLCQFKLDFRLTPKVDRTIAEQWLEAILRAGDADDPGPIDTQIEWGESWPAYHVPKESALVQCVLRAAKEVFGRKIPTAISGPSNIGNYLAINKIPTLSGFGVTGYNIHAADENLELESVLPVYETYRRAIPMLLKEL